MNARQHLMIGATAATAILAVPLQAPTLSVAPWLGLWVLRSPPRRRVGRAVLVLAVGGATQTLDARLVPAALFSLAALWGSVFPDVDHHVAPAGRWGLHAVWRGLTALAAHVGGDARWGRHRHLTHTWLGVVAPTLVLLGLGATLRDPLGRYWWWPAAGWATGVLSHLLADSTTPSGATWGVTTPQRPRPASPRAQRRRAA